MFVLPTIHHYYCVCSIVVCLIQKNNELKLIMKLSFPYEHHLGNLDAVTPVIYTCQNYGMVNFCDFNCEIVRSMHRCCKISNNY